MEKLPEFIANHWVLTLAFIFVLSMLLGDGFIRRLRGYKSVEPLEATSMINHDNAIVLDVREDKEFREGHIINALHVPLKSLQPRINELEKHKDKPILVYCRSGNRSGTACASLRKQGFANVYNVNGGIMAWQNASLPLTRD